MFVHPAGRPANWLSVWQQFEPWSLLANFSTRFVLFLYIVFNICKCMSVCAVYPLFFLFFKKFHLSNVQKWKVVQCASEFQLSICWYLAASSLETFCLSILWQAWTFCGTFGLLIFLTEYDSVLRKKNSEVVLLIFVRLDSLFHWVQSMLTLSFGRKEISGLGMSVCFHSWLRLSNIWTLLFVICVWITFLSKTDRWINFSIKSLKHFCGKSRQCCPISGAKFNIDMYESFVHLRCR